MFNIRKISALGRVFYPSLLWNLPDKNKTIYLTFDDGPIPEITPWVLSLLKEYNAKGTFFCIGENIVKHPEIFKQILSEGHRVGNHSFNHLNGWKTPSKKYVENVLKAEKSINGNLPKQLNRKERGKQGEQPLPKLFRPPYGRIKPSQIKELQKLGYQIVMWDIISGDFDNRLSARQCCDVVKKNTTPGSIVVFHDSKKAEKNLREVLPEILEFYKKEGYKMHFL